MIQKRISFTFLAVLFSAQLFGQTDSLLFSKLKWEKEKIAPGVLLKHYWFKNNLFNSNQNITIVEVKPRRRNQIDLAYEEKELKHTSEFGKAVNAIAAINGDFFDVKNGGSRDFVKSDGTVISQNSPYPEGRAIHQKAAVAIDKGKLSIVKWDGTESWENSLKAEDVMNTGALLLLNRKEEPMDTAAFSRLRNPRSAVAVLPNKHVLFITVDGRNANAAGMSLFELQDLMRWLKAKDAINLDGGGSTTLWIKGKPDNGVVNYPSDNKKWDHAGERKVANVLLVKRR
ncbi:MAG: hypothetical protein K0S09_2563 [Sphingobacteriaceae bacterium]|jgi:exopolysaccharide biosynthesis protein|nr:hypothetical protein [Sphingobacteriaceae bacterium]